MLILRARSGDGPRRRTGRRTGRIDSSALLGEMELPVQAALARVETVGIAVDHDKLEALVAGSASRSVTPPRRPTR